MSRHGTWTETGNSSGGWGIGVLAAVVAGVWLAAATKPAHHLPAAAGRNVPGEATAGARMDAAGQLAAGHGVGWWALLAAALFTAAVVLAVAAAAGWQAWTRRHTYPAAAAGPEHAVSSPARRQVEPTTSAGASVTVLADYASRTPAARRASRGGAA